ncbi:putative GPI-anchored protein pfl2 [Teleopsis dalmanni]|uniref:putative GPI-anchored protein pfl2 n=1 Tax=Teleopsis dalmanni TaxID=139649 RepID=UPI0018CE8CAB|nr:putative GPI-anchored protein pfl2 [Teleopsis dalmanni]
MATVGKHQYRLREPFSALNVLIENWGISSLYWDSQDNQQTNKRTTTSDVTESFNHSKPTIVQDKRHRMRRRTTSSTSNTELHTKDKQRTPINNNDMGENFNNGNKTIRKKTKRPTFNTTLYELVFISTYATNIETPTSQTTASIILTTVTTETLKGLSIEYISKSLHLIKSTQVKKIKPILNKTLSAITTAETIPPSDISLYSPKFSHTSKSTFETSISNKTFLAETSMESSMKFVFEPLTSTAVIKVEETLRPLNVTSSPMVSALTTSTFVSQLYSPMSSLTSQSTFGSQISLSSVTTVSILGSSTEHTSRSISLMTSSQDEETETSVNITLSAIISKRTISPTNFLLYSPIISYTSGTLLGSSVANIMRLPETSMKYSSEFISEPFISTALIEGEETGRPLNITSPSLATSTFVSLLYSPMFSFTSETTFGSQDSLTTVTTESTLESSTEFISKSISLMTSTRVEETETSVNETLSAIFPTTTLSPIDTSLYSPIFSYTYGTSFGSSVSNITRLLETSMEFSTEFISEHFISTVLTEGEETELPLNITLSSMILAATPSTFVSQFYSPMSSLTSETTFGSLDSLATVTTEPISKSSTESISKSISLMTSTQIEETEHSVNKTLSAIISTRTISPTNTSLYSPIISYTSGTSLGSSVSNITGLPETSMEYSTEFISEPFISQALSKGEESKRPLNITSSSMRSALTTCTFVSLLYSPTVSFTSETTFSSQVSLTTGTTESVLESSTEFTSRSISLMTSTQVEETETSVNETLSAIFSTKTISPIDTSLYSPIFSYTYGTSFGSLVANITGLPETSMEYSTEFISEPFISTALTEGEETELPLNITSSSMILAVRPSTFVSQLYSPMSSLTSETTFGSLVSLSTVTTEPISKSSTESISKSISLMTSTQVEETETSVNKTLSAIFSTKTILSTDTLIYSPIISYILKTSFGSSVSNITALPETLIKSSTEFSEALITTALTEVEETKRPLNITTSSMISAMTTSTFVSQLYSPMSSFTSQTTFD